MIHRLKLVVCWVVDVVECCGGYGDSCSWWCCVGGYGERHTVVGVVTVCWVVDVVEFIVVAVMVMVVVGSAVLVFMVI